MSGIAFYRLGPTGESGQRGRRRAVGAALPGRCEVGRQLKAVIHDGNHGNRVQRELIGGLQELGLEK